ncbi:MAG: M55 family metallopeptidase [Desulfobacteraceae bacterium]|nr:M55 family metallopeptidase [Desulfobacteraceae bacterium]
MSDIAHKTLLILSDIEGSSFCNDYASTQFLGKGWAKACLGMTLDVNAVVTALFDAGIENVIVKDFHRTGYNIFSSHIDKRAKLIPGYFRGPVPGVGSVHNATGLIMLGMHAPSGSDGFLAHTLTSRISRLEVNGKLLSEAQLFSASMAVFNVAPLFFSGCPVACKQASLEIKNLACFPIDKSNSKNNFCAETWRNSLAKESVKAIKNSSNHPYDPNGPFEAIITMRDGDKSAFKIAKKWGFHAKNDTLIIWSKDLGTLYMELIKLAYLTPLTLNILSIGLPIFNFIGFAGLIWAKHQLRNKN